MKLLKRLLLAIAVLLVLLIVLSALAYHYARSLPDFYHEFDWDNGQRARLAQSALDKLNQTRNLAAEAHNREARARLAGATLPGTAITAPITVSFTEQELNAFIFHNHEMFAGFRGRYERFVSKPGIFLRDGQLILAAEVKDLGYVLSAHFAPSLNADGRLNLKLLKMRGGRLPLPQALLASQIKQVREALGSRLDGWRRQAKMGPSGECNESLVALGMSRLLLAALAGEPAEPVLFMPLEEPLLKSCLPLRITDLRVDGQEAALTLELTPMTPEERQAAFQRIVGSPPAGP